MNAKLGWRAWLLGPALVAAIATPVAAQQLTPAQEQIYQRRHISIEVAGVTIGSANRMMITATTHNVWLAHEGFMAISDSTFFVRMGMPNEALESGHYVATRRTFARWGMITSGVGIVGMLATAGTAVNGNWTPFWVSTGVSLVGISFLYVALAHTGNRYPVSTVAELPDTYNAQLRARIFKGDLISSRGTGASPPERLLVGLRVPVR